MPQKAQYTKAELVDAALALVRAEGFSALTARALGARLGCSTRPIFTVFQSMEELQGEVLQAANAMYQHFLEEDMTSGRYPPYKASGMAYIRFAKEEKKLFKLLFMRDRSHERSSADPAELRPLIELIERNTGLSEQGATQLHLMMWVYVHGIATMLATDYLDWDWETISEMLTDSYEAMRHRFTEKEAR